MLKTAMRRHHIMWSLTAVVHFNKIQVIQAEPMTIFISFFVSTKMKFRLAYANKKVTKRDKEKKRYEKEVILIPFHKGGMFQPGHQK